MEWLNRNALPIVVLVVMVAFISYLGATGQLALKTNGDLVTEMEAELEEWKKCQEDAAKLYSDFQDIKKEMAKINAKLDTIGVKLMQAEVAEMLRVKR